MKFSIITILILFVVSFCAPKQLKQEDIKINETVINSTASNKDTDKVIIQKEVNGINKDTSILGVPYYRIDSFKIAGRKSGGHPADDSTTAMYLRLSDSTRVIGIHTLDYNGQLFTKLEFNKTNRKQLDVEIIEERKGIVSIQERMLDKPSYFPLLNQKIEFYNNKNQLINTFNINTNNPFLKDKTKKVIEHRYPPPDDRSAKLSKQDINWKNHVKKYYAYNRFNVQENGYVIVEYNLYAMDVNEGILQSISTLVVLDSLGKEYCRFNELENMIHYYLMVSGGKYLMVNGGGILGEGFQRLEKSFLKIYEVRSKKLIYSEELENVGEDYRDFYESEPPIKIMTEYGSYINTDDNLFTELIFDLETRTRCIKIFSMIDWKRVTNEGIKYSGNVWLHEFDFDCKTF